MEFGFKIVVIFKFSGVVINVEDLEKKFEEIKLEKKEEKLKFVVEFFFLLKVEILFLKEKFRVFFLFLFVLGVLLREF